MADGEARQAATEHAAKVMGDETPGGEVPAMQVKGEQASMRALSQFHHPSLVVVNQILSSAAATEATPTGLIDCRGEGEEKEEKEGK